MKWKPLIWAIILIVGLFLLTSWISAKSTSWIKDIRWKLPKHKSRTYKRRRLEQIEQIIIHHSAAPETQTPEQIASYHVGPNHVCDAGCPAIAYHFMIDRAAIVYQVNDLEAISYHASGQNTRSIGICLIGNYDELELTDELIFQTKRLIQYLEQKLGKSLQIAPHRKYAEKSCPGWNIDVEQIFQIA